MSTTTMTQPTIPPHLSTLTTWKRFCAASSKQAAGNHAEAATLYDDILAHLEDVGQKLEVPIGAALVLECYPNLWEWDKVNVFLTVGRYLFEYGEETWCAKKYIKEREEGVKAMPEQVTDSAGWRFAYNTMNDKDFNTRYLVYKKLGFVQYKPNRGNFYIHEQSGLVVSATVGKWSREGFEVRTKEQCQWLDKEFSCAYFDRSELTGFQLAMEAQLASEHRAEDMRAAV